MPSSAAVKLCKSSVSRKRAPGTTSRMRSLASAKPSASLTMARPKAASSKNRLGYQAAYKVAKRAVVSGSLIGVQRWTQGKRRAVAAA